MADIPKPKKIAVMDTHVPKAFATGRNPRNAVVAVTRALMSKLNEEEVEAVLAHELWIYNYKRGAFYPLVPTGSEQRDNAAEMRLGTIMEEERIRPRSRWSTGTPSGAYLSSPVPPTGSRPACRPLCAPSC